jgi:hypothetical protein
MSIRIMTAEQLRVLTERVLTEIVVICLCRELQHRACVAPLCHSNGNHTPIYKADCYKVSNTRLMHV